MFYLLLLFVRVIGLLGVDGHQGWGMLRSEMSEVEEVEGERVRGSKILAVEVKALNKL